MLLLCCNLLQQMPAKIIKIEHGSTEFSRKWKGAIFATPRPHRAVTVACCLELRWLLTRLCIERCTGRDVEPTSSVPGFVSSLQAEYYYYNDVTKPNSPCFRAGLRISWTAPLNGLLFFCARFVTSSLCDCVGFSLSLRLPLSRITQYVTDRF